MSIVITLAFFFREKSGLEAQPKHVSSCLGVESDKQEGEGILGGVRVELHDFVLAVDARELLAESFDLLVVSEPPNAHAANVLSENRPYEVDDLTRDDPSDAEVPTSRGQGNEPASVVASLSFVQNITTIR